MVKLEADNGMEAKFLGLVLAVRGFASMVNLIGILEFIEQYTSQGVTTGEVQCTTLQGKTPRSSLSWLC
jgi:hypothetical protein